ncbi:hypothetical protein SAMD00019534_042750 [Acytostelium subglobosum LB1]|uniref:hypothetical protein n=1 Tax=Acytostelium subglobosum LB1 TaxID=1410327 RepID=UPI000644E385|nr:hypothetical protein SAMD00019534_042750 [Acytostelium subglobosum LB1]GAM21100.1 hypothetical protein SAMD00019534_042750 [Acytostelium subglobosum LB1]|eukprot:XP_012756234.1 hypothetical protein SAMD00019534_042750 [Acytostelium subglobosum LB1]
MKYSNLLCLALVVIVAIQLTSSMRTSTSISPPTSLVGFAFGLDPVAPLYIKINLETGHNINNTLPLQKKQNIQSILQVYDNDDVLVYYMDTDSQGDYIGDLSMYHPGNNTMTRLQTIPYTQAESTYEPVILTGAGYNAKTNTMYSFVQIYETYDLGVLSISFKDQSFGFTSLSNSWINVTAAASCFDPIGEKYYIALLLIDSDLQIATYDTVSKSEVMLFNVSLGIDIDNSTDGTPHFSVYVWDSMMYVFVGSTQEGFPLWIGVVNLATQQVKTIVQDNIPLYDKNLPPFTIDHNNGYMSAFAIDNTGKTYLYMLDLSTQDYTKTSEPNLWVNPQDFIYESILSS